MKVSYNPKEALASIVNVIASSFVIKHGGDADTASMVGNVLEGGVKGFSIKCSLKEQLSKEIQGAIETVLNNGNYELSYEWVEKLNSTLFSPENIYSYLGRNNVYEQLILDIEKCCRSFDECDISTLPAKEFADDLISELNDRILENHDLVGQYTLSEVKDIKAALFDFIQKQVPVAESTFSFKPDYEHSERPSHVLIRAALKEKKHIVIPAKIKEAILIEQAEVVPRLKDIAYFKFLYVHYSFFEFGKHEHLMSIIDEILQTKDIEKDSEFYCDVLLEKVNVLLQSRNVKKAATLLKHVEAIISEEQRVDSSYCLLAGRVNELLGEVEIAVHLFNEARTYDLNKMLVGPSKHYSAHLQHFLAHTIALIELYQRINRPDLIIKLWDDSNMEDYQCDIWPFEYSHIVLAYVECLISYKEYEQASLELSNIEELIKDENDAHKCHFYRLEGMNYSGLEDWIAAENSFLNALQYANEANKSLLYYLLADAQRASGRKVADETYRKAKEFSGANNPEGDHNPSVVNDPDKALKILLHKQRKCETVYEKRDTIRSIISIYNEMNDDKNALIWYDRIIDICTLIQDSRSLAQAVGEKAQILFYACTNEAEENAKCLLDKASQLLEPLPFYQEQAFIKWLLGRYFAHQEKFEATHGLFEKAASLLYSNGIQHGLYQVISSGIDDVNWIIEKYNYSEISLELILQELEYLKTWMPDYEDDILQFLWYEKSDDIEKGIRSSYSSKALFVSDDENEIMSWCDEFAALFDLFSFSTETNYMNSENWNFAKQVPIPPNMAVRNVNVFSIVK